MRPFARFMATAAMGTVLLGAPLLAQDINVDYNHSFKFNQVKSYSWGKIQVSDPMVEPKISIAIDRAMQGYGFKESDKNKKGDVIVSVVEARSPQGYASFYRGMTNVDWHRGWGGGGFSDGTSSVRQIHGGTLVIDLYDGATGKLIWRGTAAAGEPSKDDTSQQKLGYSTIDGDHVDKTVSTMFAKYPPTSGGPLPPNQNEVRLSPSSQGLESPN